jgi:hypothetical protein
MIDPDKPNPFQILGLSTDATNEEIVSRGQELDIIAETDDQRLLYRWAIEQLLTRPLTRLEYELFEVPDARYEDPEWEAFARAHRRNPVDLASLVKDARSPTLDDFDLAALFGLLLRDMLAVGEADIRTAVEGSPFQPGYGPPPLEVKDVIFG